MGIFGDKIRVGVVRGGPSPEYEVSLDTGRAVLDNLDKEIYEPVDIYISREGNWHAEGVEKPIEKIVRRTDVIFNALHGTYGEDGTVQKILDKLAVPYTGSGAVASVLGMNKNTSKRIYERGGLKTPFSVLISSNGPTAEIRDQMRYAYRSVPSSFVVKPVGAGSSVGVSIISSLPEMEEAVVSAFTYSPSVLVEEFIEGKEATCGVVEDFRGARYHALLPIEIRPKNTTNFFDYSAKYSDPSSGQGAEEICPGNFTQEEKNAIEGMAIMAHSILGLRHYSRSDFRVHPKRGVFILETNTLPGLTKNSLLPKSLLAAGTKLSDFLHHIIGLAMNRK